MGFIADNARCLLFAGFFGSCQSLDWVGNLLAAGNLGCALVLGISSFAFLLRAPVRFGAIWMFF